MRITELDEYIKKNHLETPDDVQFQKVVDAFGYYKPGPDPVTKEDFRLPESVSIPDHAINLAYERGILQYGLVKKYAPTNIMEFGTGSAGFSTLCMALATHQIHEKGDIFTIDYLPHNEKFLHHYKKQNEIHEIHTTRYDYWKNSDFSHVLDNVIPLSGFASEITSKHKFPKIQFFNYDISGSHYTSVKNSFLSSLILTDSKSYCLINTYTDATFGTGVKKFVDEDIAPVFDVEMIVVDKSNYWVECGATNSPYGMCFFEIKKDEMIEHFGLRNIEQSIQQYRRFEKRLKFRTKLNKKLPFLKNTKFNVLSKS